MALSHYFGTATNSKNGAGLPGWFVEVVSKADLSTVQAIYADESGTPISTVSGATNRAKSDDSGNFDFFVAEGAYGLRYYDSAGTFQRVERIVQMFRAGYKRDESGASERTYTQKMAAEVSLEDFGGGTAQTATENVAALTSAIAALPSGGVVTFETNGSYPFSATSIAADNITLRGRGGTTLTWASLGAGVTGLAVTGNRFAAEGLIFSGPGAETTYTASAFLVTVIGASTSARLSGLRFTNCSWQNCGSTGLRAKWVDNIVIDTPRASNIAYAGLEFLSCDRGRIYGGTIDVRGAVGDSGNAYGVSLSHDNTNYSGDPLAGTPRAANPFCNDWVVDGVTVIGPKIWQGIDTHGCYNVTVTNCKVHAAARGIALTAGSNAAANYAGWRNKCIGNVVDINYPDDTASGAIPQEGITLNGGATFAQTDLVCTGNTVRGYGASTTYSIRMSAYCQRFVVSQNHIVDWQGIGIYCQTGTTDGLLSDNVFGEPAATAAECINITGADSPRMRIGGNLVAKGATRQPSIGVRFAVASSARILVDPNGFDLCSVSYLSGVGVAHGPGLPGVVNVSGSGAVTADCAIAALAPNVPITVEFSGLTGAITGVTLNNVPIGGQVVLVNKDATNSVTFTRAVSALAGGVNWVGDQYDTLRLMRQDIGVATFVELSRSSNS